MTQSILSETMSQLAVPGKGILAADESYTTIGKRFESIQVENSENNRRDYRELLFTTPNLNQYISGVILFEETLNQKSCQGIPFGELLTQREIVPGIKVDQGLVALNTEGEKITQGLDDLATRLEKYQALGAQFAKWRAVFKIQGLNLPSHRAIQVNAHALGRYARICQDMGIVPIVEPEVLMDGDHTLQQCEAITRRVLEEVMNEQVRNSVSLEHIILKPSMVIQGSECKTLASVDEVATRTVKILKQTILPTVQTINFLSGGQSPALATQHLNRMQQLHDDLPWQLSFSYGRALQEPSLRAWQGKPENVSQAQQLLHLRAKLNSLASQGEYDPSMEPQEATIISH